MAYQSKHTGTAIDAGIDINDAQNSRLTALENKDINFTTLITDIQNNVQTNINNIKSNTENIQINADNIAINTENISTIQSTLNNKFENIALNYGGTSGTQGYCAMADIHIVNNYSNAPIEFKIFQRGKATPCWLFVSFQNLNGLDPALNSFKHFGTSCGAILQKVTTSQWRLWVTKSEGYDSPTLIHYTQGLYNQFKITFPKVFSTSKPSGTASTAL